MALKYLFVYDNDLGEIYDSNGAILSAASGVDVELNGGTSFANNLEPIVSTDITDGKTYQQGFDGGSNSTYAGGGATYRVRAVVFPANLSGNRIAGVALGLEILNILPPASIPTNFGPGSYPLTMGTVTFGGGWEFANLPTSLSNSWLRLIVDL